MSSVEIEERRRTPRHRLGKLATIKLGIGIAPRYCLVSNVSTEGVRIHVNGFEVLDDFVLLFPEGAEGRSGTYKVVWRNGLDIGAKFLNAATQNA
jgi:PilZ domain-containing protein